MKKPKPALVRALVERYRVDKPGAFRLRDVDCADTAGVTKGRRAEQLLAWGVEQIGDLQERLYAQNRWSVLLVFQAMDAAGKDSTIKHVMSGINPMGCQVWSFKRPSEEELDHDWLWRGLVRLPERGRIGIHNRSWYEEVLVVRVHPEILEGQKLPPALVTKKVWEERYESINEAERHLARNGTLILKFFLHVSKDEQRERLLARLDDKSKQWKFEANDVKERDHWDDYMSAYEDAIRATSKPGARWHVIPADHKWFMRLVVAATVVEALEELSLKYPEVSAEQAKEFAESRALLVGKGKGNGKAKRKGKAKDESKPEAPAGA